MMNEKFLVNHKFWRQVKKKKQKKHRLSIGETNRLIKILSTLNLFIYFYKCIFFNTKIIIG